MIPHSARKAQLQQHEDSFAVHVEIFPEEVLLAHTALEESQFQNGR